MPVFSSVEQFKNFPYSFQHLIDQLAERASTLQRCDSIEALVSLYPVSETRLEYLRRTRPDALDVPALENLGAFDAIASAHHYLGRLVPITDSEELEAIRLLCGPKARRIYVLIRDRYYDLSLFD